MSSAHRASGTVSTCLALVAGASIWRGEAATRRADRCRPELAGRKSGASARCRVLASVDGQPVSHDFAIAWSDSARAKVITRCAPKTLRCSLRCSDLRAAPDGQCCARFADRGGRFAAVERDRLLVRAPVSVDDVETGGAHLGCRSIGVLSDLGPARKSVAVCTDHPRGTREASRSHGSSTTAQQQPAHRHQNCSHSLTVTPNRSDVLRNGAELGRAAFRTEVPCS